MSWTVDTIQQQIASELDQSDSAPTAGGTDWTIRLNTINRALRDYAQSYDWDALKVIENGNISTSTGNASYAMPSGFRKIDSYARIMSDGKTTYDHPIVDPSENLLYSDTDRYVNILGNESDGYTMYIHSGTLSSGASVQFTYWRWPATLSTTTDVAMIPDASYLVQRSLYYLYKGREDGRFPEAKVEADRILARMVENENVRGWGEKGRRVQVGQHPYRNWRIGRD